MTHNSQANLSGVSQRTTAQEERKMSVLFVDNQPQVLRGIERMLDAADIDWDTEFVTSAEEALEILADDDDIDTVVTEMKMPGIDGAEFLVQVSKLYPHVVRVVLSGEARRESVFKMVSPMHQYLAKPCEAEELRETISRASALRDILISSELQTLIGGISSLPSVPAIHQKLMTELESEHATSESVGEIIAKDPAMTAKILQMANSAVFGCRQQVQSPARAANFLGMETIKALALTVGVFKEYEGIGVHRFSIDSLMSHCLKVAQLSKQIARHEKLDSGLASDAFTAGLLHDIGKLVLLASDPVRFTDVLDLSETAGLAISDAERQIFGADHAAVGAYILSLWGLPQSIIEVVALHHDVASSGEETVSILTAVSAANRLEHCGDTAELLDMDPSFGSYLENTGCRDKLDSWLEIKKKLDGEEQVDNG